MWGQWCGGQAGRSVNRVLVGRSIDWMVQIARIKCLDGAMAGGPMGVHGRAGGSLASCGGCAPVDQNIKKSKGRRRLRRGASTHQIAPHGPSQIESVAAECCRLPGLLLVDRPARYQISAPLTPPSRIKKGDERPGSRLLMASRRTRPGGWRSRRRAKHEATSAMRYASVSPAVLRGRGSPAAAGSRRGQLATVITEWAATTLLSKQGCSVPLWRRLARGPESILWDTEIDQMYRY